MVRILQASDSHLSPASPYSGANWKAVVDHVREHEPDLVVHTGDITLNGADDIEDLRHARRLLDELTVPWLAIPGNHDIGDFGDTDQPVNDARRQRYAGVFGPANWSRVIDDWRLVGVDVQTLLSTLPEADGLWDWLAGELDGPAPTVLFLHRPLHPWDPGEIDDARRYIMEPGRSRLTTLMGQANVQLVACGHVHQWRSRGGECAHVWAPPTWATLPEHIQPTIGTKLVGVVEHDLGQDGHVTSTVVLPRGIAQVTIGDDFESPYTH